MNDRLDVLPCGYLSFKDNGIITWCNTTLASWLEFPRDELIGKSIEKIFTLATRIFYNTHFFPLVKLHSKANEIFLSLQHKDSHDLPVLANAERRFEDQAYIIHCVFIQVNERKKYEQEILNAKREAEHAAKENKQLLQLTRSLEQQAIELDKHYRAQVTVNENLLEFSKIISHDLQEPIRKIRIFADLISRDPNSVLSDRGRELCVKIEHAGEKLKTLTTSLKQYISIDNEKAFTQVRLNAVIETAKAKAISFRQFSDFDMEIENMPSIEGYASQLELLFFHLIDNSIQFRDAHRRLSIRVNGLMLKENIFRASKDRYKYTEHVRVSFEDNGVGFPDQYKEYVFTLLKTMDDSNHGLGLGLSVVKKVVNNHSGVVRVESQPGVGTRFEIELPSKMTG